MKKTYILNPLAPYLANKLPLPSSQRYQPGTCRFFKPSKNIIDQNVSYGLLAHLGQRIDVEVLTKLVMQSPSFGKRGGKCPEARASFIMSYLRKEGMLLEV